MPPSIGNSIDRADEDRFIRHFGMSSEHFQRELEEEFEQATPEEQAEFERLVDEANAVLPGMLATVDRMSESLADTGMALNEMTKYVSSLTERISMIENNLSDIFAQKPLPFRGGVGVGTVRQNRASDSLTVPTPGPSPEGEGGR